MAFPWGRVSLEGDGSHRDKVWRFWPLCQLLTQVEGPSTGKGRQIGLGGAQPVLPPSSFFLGAFFPFCFLLLPPQLGLESSLPGQSLLRKLGLSRPHAELSAGLRLCSPRLALPRETFLKASRISLVSSPCSHAQPQDKSRVNESGSSWAGNSWLPWQLGLLRICIRLMIFIAQPHLRQAGEISIFPAPSQLGRGGGQEGDI